jgi:hypothetical protein
MVNKSKEIEKKVKEESEENDRQLNSEDFEIYMNP